MVAISLTSGLLRFISNFLAIVCIFIYQSSLHALTRRSQVQVAIDARRIDAKLLIFSSAGVICCRMATAFLTHRERKLEFSIAPLMREHFCKEVFNVMADLDVPTRTVRSGDVSDPDVWQSLSVILDLIFFFACSVANICVLAAAIGCQQNGITFVVMHLGLGVFDLLRANGQIFSHRPG